MNIISVGFLAFVLLVTAVYYLLPLKLRPCWLLAASLLFYIYADIRYLLFLGASILSCYAGALAIQGRVRGRKLIFLLVLLFNLGLLACVKFLPYSLNVLGLLLGRELPQPRFLVPLGISFYTLQALSYLIDVYRGEAQGERSLWKFTLYMSFFPIIMQGPICRYSQLSPQLSSPHRLDYRQLKFGAQLMLWGFFKKLVIADRAGLLVNQVFDNYEAYAGLSVFVAMCLYTLQLYADFSGCVDISRGVSGMLGISLPDNFRRPLFSQSIQEFWRRWHISLSSWFRDYVYIPLGGNRKGPARKYLNIMVVFALSGLWHGVGINYLFWGLLHGGYQVLGGLSRRPKAALLRRLGVAQDSRALVLLRRLLCFLLVSFAFLFFRAPGLRAGMHMASAMLLGSWLPQLSGGALLNLGLDGADLLVLALALAILLAVSIIQERQSLRELISRQRLPLRWTLYLLCLFAVLIFGIYGPGYDSAQFIYMNF